MGVACNLLLFVSLSSKYDLVSRVEVKQCRNLAVSQQDCKLASSIWGALVIAVAW